MGDYIYPASGSNSVRPHAVKQIPWVGTHEYDDNGNLLSTTRSSRSVNIDWTSFDMPKRISKGEADSSQFTYGPEHQRSKQIKTSQPNGNPAVTTTYYAGAQETDINNGQATVKTYWPYGLGVEIDQPGSSTSELNWSHHDRLGSIISISDSSGNLKEKLAYDSWGKRRTNDGSATPDNLDGQVDNKGYTGHEMLDQLDLVHMNGRIYDPLMARFLSADPMIQDPAHSQSYNRYTYVWNNPTNLTDPTGFVAADERDLLSDTLTFLKSGLGFTESKSESADEKPKTGGADNSGGQGKSSQTATVTVTGSLAQARAEQWLFAKKIEAAFSKDFRAIKEPIIKLGTRVVVRTGWQMTAGAFSGPAAPLIEGALIIGGVYELGKGIYDIVKKNEGGDTSAEAALSGASSGEATKTGNNVNTPDQQALGDLVKGESDNGRKPISNQDAETLLDWGRELGKDVRDDRKKDHWIGGPHIHIPGTGVKHIPVEKK